MLKINYEICCVVKTRMCDLKCDLDLTGWQKDAAEMLLNKLNVCSRCVLRICGCRSARLFALSVSNLRGIIQDHLGISAAESGTTVCSMCLGILSHAECTETLDAVSTEIAKIGYDTASVTAFMLSLSIPASVCIRQHVVCLHLHQHLQAKLGSEVASQ